MEKGPIPSPPARPRGSPPLNAKKPLFGSARCSGRINDGAVVADQIEDADQDADSRTRANRPPRIAGLLARERGLEHR